MAEEDKAILGPIPLTLTGDQRRLLEACYKSLVEKLRKQITYGGH